MSLREQYFKLDIPYKVNKKLCLSQYEIHGTSDFGKVAPVGRKRQRTQKLSRGKYVYNTANFTGDDLVQSETRDTNRHGARLQEVFMRIVLVGYCATQAQERASAHEKNNCL